MLGMWTVLPVAAAWAAERYAPTVYVALFAGVLWVALLWFARRGELVEAGHTVELFGFAGVILAFRVYGWFTAQTVELPSAPEWLLPAVLAILSVVHVVRYRPRLTVPSIRLRRSKKPRPAVPPPPTKSLLRLPVAKLPNGDPWHLDLETALHTLIAGASGAGKGSAAWSIITALEDAIREGLVRLVLFDPKNGMELSAAEGMAARFCYMHSGEDLEDYAERVVETLEGEVLAMGRRAAELRSRRARKVTPTVEHPVTVMLFDELASMSNLPDRQLQKRADKALATLLEQGRAPGWLLIGCTQDASQETVGSHLGRLFTNRICLRVNAKADVDVVLRSPGSRSAGARADLILPRVEAGVAYVLNDEPRVDEETGEVVDRFLRIRFNWVGDRELEELRARWPVHAEPAPETTYEAVEPAPVSLAGRLAQVWPETDLWLHLDEIAALLGEPFVTEDELTRGGVAVVPSVRRRRLVDGVWRQKRALGVCREGVTGVTGVSQGCDT